MRRRRLPNPLTLTSWLTKPATIRLANRTRPAQGYVTLPFWLWVAETYPTAFVNFMATPPPTTSWVVDHFADLIGQESGDPVGFEGVVTLFGTHLVLGDWLSPSVQPIYDIEQPTRVVITIPAFAPPRGTGNTQELANNDSTWVSTDNMLPNAEHVQHAIADLELAAWRLPRFRRRGTSCSSPSPANLRGSILRPSSTPPPCSSATSRSGPRPASGPT